MGSELLPASEFGRALGEGVLERPELTLDPRNRDDRLIALAATAVDEHEGLVVDITKIAAMMKTNFAIAPARYSGKRIRRRMDRNDGEVIYYRKGWSFRFEPGAALGYHGGYDRPWIRSKPVVVPPIPAQHRPERITRNHYIVWEQAWSDIILRPRDPALLEHIVGDVYVVLGTWDLTPLEAAALRTRRMGMIPWNTGLYCLKTVIPGSR